MLFPCHVMSILLQIALILHILHIGLFVILILNRTPLPNSFIQTMTDYRFILAHTLSIKSIIANLVSFFAKLVKEQRHWQNINHSHIPANSYFYYTKWIYLIMIITRPPLSSRSPQFPHGRCSRHFPSQKRWCPPAPERNSVLELFLLLKPFHTVRTKGELVCAFTGGLFCPPCRPVLCIFHGAALLLPALCLPCTVLCPHIAVFHALSGGHGLVQCLNVT